MRSKQTIMKSECFKLLEVLIFNHRRFDLRDIRGDMLKSKFTHELLVIMYRLYTSNDLILGKEI